MPQHRADMTDPEITAISLEQLPDPVLLQIIARVHICDAVSLAQTSQRLRELVLDAPGTCAAAVQCVTGKLAAANQCCAVSAGVPSSTLDPDQSITLSSVLSAADQRLHAGTGGTWKDALLFAAWQRQQSSASDTAAPRRSIPAAPAAALVSPMLQRVLDTPDAAAAVVAGEIATCGSTRGMRPAHSSPPAATAGSTARQRGPGRSTEFGLYWQPGELCVHGGSVTSLQHTVWAVVCSFALKGPAAVVAITVAVAVRAACHSSKLAAGSAAQQFTCAGPLKLMPISPLCKTLAMNV